MAARIVAPDAPDYDDLRRSNIPRYNDIRPSVILRCGTAADVVEALGYARNTGMPVAVRGGGHCFAGRSSTAGVLIDVRDLAGVTVDGDRAVIGAATLLGEVYDALFAHGRTIPAGCGPTVGIAGLTLGGGLGILGRSHGLTSDRLRAATVVLPDGSNVDCSEDREPDLFWMLRGGGAPGVVTSLTFDTVAAPESTAFRLFYPAGSAADVLDGWQSWAPDAADAVAASLVLTTSGDPARPPAVVVFGAVLGDATAGADLLRDLSGRFGVAPAAAAHRHGTHRGTKRWLSTMDPHHGGPEDPQGHTYQLSEFFRATVPAADLVAHLAADRRPGEFRELDFSPWGGAYNRVAPAATAFPHRDARFLLKHAVTVGAADGNTGWLDASYAITHPYGTGGAYPNFPEPGVPDTVYHAANTARLRRIRAAYDPAGVFAAASGL